MAKKGLREWVKERWVDIGAPKKDGKYQPCLLYTSDAADE